MSSPLKSIGFFNRLFLFCLVIFGIISMYSVFSFDPEYSGLTYATQNITTSTFTQFLTDLADIYFTLFGNLAGIVTIVFTVLNLIFFYQKVSQSFSWILWFMFWLGGSVVAVGVNAVLQNLSHQVNLIDNIFLPFGLTTSVLNYLVPNAGINFVLGVVLVILGLVIMYITQLKSTVVDYYHYFTSVSLDRVEKEEYERTMLKAAILNEIREKELKAQAQSSSATELLYRTPTLSPKDLVETLEREYILARDLCASYESIAQTQGLTLQQSESFYIVKILAKQKEQELAEYRRIIASISHWDRIKFAISKHFNKSLPKPQFYDLTAYRTCKVKTTEDLSVDPNNTTIDSSSSSFTANLNQVNNINTDTTTVSNNIITNLSSNLSSNSTVYVSANSKTNKTVNITNTTNTTNATNISTNLNISNNDINSNVSINITNIVSNISVSATNIVNNISASVSTVSNVSVNTTNLDINNKNNNVSTNNNTNIAVTANTVAQALDNVTIASNLTLDSNVTSNTTILSDKNIANSSAITIKDDVNITKSSQETSNISNKTNITYRANLTSKTNITDISSHTDKVGIQAEVKSKGKLDITINPNITSNINLNTNISNNTNITGLNAKITGHNVTVTNNNITTSNTNGTMSTSNFIVSESNVTVSNSNTSLADSSKAILPNANLLNNISSTTNNISITTSNTTNLNSKDLNKDVSSLYQFSPEVTIGQAGTTGSNLEYKWNFTINNSVQDISTSSPDISTPASETLNLSTPSQTLSSNLSSTASDEPLVFVSPKLMANHNLNHVTDGSLNNLTTNHNVSKTITDHNTSNITTHNPNSLHKTIDTSNFTTVANNTVVRSQQTPSPDSSSITQVNTIVNDMFDFSHHHLEDEKNTSDVSVNHSSNLDLSSNSSWDLNDIDIGLNTTTDVNAKSHPKSSPRPTFFKRTSGLTDMESK